MATPAVRGLFEAHLPVASLPASLAFYREVVGLELAIPAEEISARVAALAQPEPKYTRGYGRLFLEHVLQADEGCDFDFLRRRPGEPLEPDPLGLVGGPIGGW